MPPDRAALLVDDDSGIAGAVLRAAELRQVQITKRIRPDAALDALDETAARLLVLAITDGGAARILLETIVKRWSELPAVIVARSIRPRDVLRAVELGATDVLDAASTAEEIGHALDRALARTDPARPRPRSPDIERDLLGTSPVMEEVRESLESAAQSAATVLVRGESGTGKELAARAIHRLGARSSGPFVKVDCAALPENLLESELFGYEKGAFTGASSRKPGRVELAAGGTLFLDEIGELPLSLQAKMLSFLQHREITHLGGNAPITVDTRLVSATHRDLETMVDRREFRQDLFYRLNVVPLWLPPLRARRDDIALLSRHFAEVARQEHGRDVRLEDEAVRFLRKQRWPGNVRQLENFVHRLVVLSKGPRVDAAAAAAELSKHVTFATEPASTIERYEPVRRSGQPERLQVELRLAEKSAVERALAQTGGNRSRAARLLGVSRSHFYALLSEHGLI